MGRVFPARSRFAQEKINERAERLAREAEIRRQEKILDRDTPLIKQEHFVEEYTRLMQQRGEDVLPPELYE